MSVVRKNIISLLFSQAATWMISIVLLILAPSRLGSANFGRVQFVLAYVGFFGLIGSLGSSPYLVKRVARDPQHVGRIVADGLKLKLFLGLGLSLVALTLGNLLWHDDSDTLMLIPIAALIMMFAMLNEIECAGLAGLERIAGTAIWTTVQVYVGSGLAIIVLLTSRSVPLYVLCFGVGAACPVVANYIRLRSLIRQRTARLPRAKRAIVQGGVPFVVLEGLTLIYGTIDIPILKSISGSSVVGWYAVAYRWVSIPVFISLIVTAAYLPRLSVLASEKNHGEFSRCTNTAISWVLFVSIPASVGIAIIAPDIIHLFYGDEYARSVVLVRILAIHLPLATLDSVLGTALIASDRQNKYLIVAGSAAVFNPILCVVLVHLTQNRYGNGAIGAAIVTVATELFIMVGALKLRTRGVMDRHTVAYIGRCVLGATVMAAAVYVLGDIAIVVKIAVGLIAYTAASVVLRTVSPSSVRGLLRGAPSGTPVLAEVGETAQG